MKDRIKTVLVQTVFISFMMLVMFSISAITEKVRGGESVYQWYIPVSMVVVAFLTSLPSLILETAATGKGKLVLRIAIHFVLLYAVVMTGGYFFKWYSTGPGFVSVSISFTLIYILVWLVTISMFKRDETIINRELEKYRDDE